MVSSGPLSTAGSAVSQSLGRGGAPRSLLVKAFQRSLRSAVNRVRAAEKRAPRAVCFSFIFVAAALVVAVGSAGVLVADSVFSSPSVRVRVAGEGDSEKDYFSHRVWSFVPRQKSFGSADLIPCSWLYLEVNAYDGRDLLGFFTNGNSFLEETLRAEVSPARAFCAVALESDPAHAAALSRIRQRKGHSTRRFDVFTGISTSASVPSVDRYGMSSSVYLPNFIRQLTFDRLESRREETEDMVTALANGHNGSVIARISGAVSELYPYLDALEKSGVLCDRVDRLVLNVTSTVRDSSQPSDVYAPSSPKFDPAKGVAGLVAIAAEFESRTLCHARIFVTDTNGELVAPLPISDNAVFYAVLAGEPTFDERVSAQTDSWMRGVPLDRVALFTNIPRFGHDLDAARGRQVIGTGQDAVLEPSRPAAGVVGPFYARRPNHQVASLGGRRHVCISGRNA
jgi:hypothetical protein